jgi:hypothetical protein
VFVIIGPQLPYAALELLLMALRVDAVQLMALRLALLLVLLRLAARASLGPLEPSGKGRSSSLPPPTAARFHCRL